MANGIRVPSIRRHTVRNSTSYVHSLSLVSRAESTAMYPSAQSGSWSLYCSSQAKTSIHKDQVSSTATGTMFNWSSVCLSRDRCDVAGRWKQASTITGSHTTNCDFCRVVKSFKAVLLSASRGSQRATSGPVSIKTVIFFAAICGESRTSPGFDHGHRNFVLEGGVDPGTVHKCRV